MKSHDVSVHIIEPGFFDTPITNSEKNARLFKENWKAIDPRLKEQYPLDVTEKCKETIRVNFVIVVFLNVGADEEVKKAEAFMNKDIGLVVNCYERAVTELFPRPRYTAGPDAKFFFVPMTYLPEWLSDGIMTFQDIKAKMQ